MYIDFNRDSYLLLLKERYWLPGNLLLTMFKRRKKKKDNNGDKVEEEEM